MACSLPAAGRGAQVRIIPVFRPFEAFIGMRYVRAQRRSHFISFISLSSILGVAVGVMVVITVLSVMNGFDKVMTDRTLAMVSHATVSDTDGVFNDWAIVAADLSLAPGIAGVAPYFRSEAMLTHDDYSSGVFVHAILPEQEKSVSDISGRMLLGDFDSLRPGEFGIIIGKELAQNLGVLTDMKVNLVITTPNNTPFGMMQRSKRFTVTGIFEAGMREFDSSMVLIHLDDARTLFRIDGPEALRVKTDDAIRAGTITRTAVQGINGSYEVTDWTQRNKNFYQALKTEKIAMFVILGLIVGVAAFNIVSTLVMVVVDKQSDIAVLRTLGASPLSIMKIFIIQGSLIGIAGLLAGDILGIWLANNIDAIVKLIERIFNVDVLPCDVYYVCEFPSDLHWNDVASISIVALSLSLVATIYPAWRASRTRPVEALRYE